MKHIYFDSVSAKNVRAHTDIAMEFPIGKFYVITGKNGNGKSTIYKAISMALYGDDGACEGERSSLEEMVNLKVGKNLEIIFQFHIVNEDDSVDNYKIELRHKHKIEKNGLFLYRNGIDVSGKTKTDTYRIIENTLVPRDIYHTIVYFNQQVKDFFTALKNSKQKEIFNTILELGDYADYYATTTEKIKVLNEQLAAFHTNNATIDVSISEKQQTEKRLVEMLANEKSRNASKIVEAIRKIEEENSTILALNTKLETIHFDQRILDNVNKEIGILNHQLEELKKGLAQLDTNTNNELESELTTLKTSLENDFTKMKSGIEAEFFKVTQTKESDIQSILEEMSTIDKKYNTSDLEREKSEFEREKNKEKHFVMSEISQIESKFTCADIEHDRDIKVAGVQNFINEIKTNVVTIQSEAKNIMSDVEKWKSDMGLDESNLSKADPTCSKCQQTLPDSNKKYVQECVEINRDKIKVAEAKIETSKQKLKKLESEYEKSKIEIDRLRLDYQKVIDEQVSTKNIQKHALEAKMELIDLEISTKTLQLNDSIKQMIIVASSEKEKLQEKKQILQREKTQVSQIKDTKIEELKTQSSSAFDQSKREYIKRYLGILKDRQGEMETKLTELQSSLNEKSSILTSLNETKVVVDSVKTDIATHEETNRGHEIQLKEFNEKQFDDSEITKLTNEIVRLKEQKAASEIENAGLLEKLKILEFWKEGFSDRGIKSMLIDSSIPFLNRNINKELEKMAPGMFGVSFDTLTTTKGGNIRDKFSVNVLHKIKGTNQFKLLSGGEKRMIDLSVMKSLNKLAENLYQKKFHVTLNDEILDAFDDENAALYCQLMKLMSTDEHVSLITHKMFEHIEADKIFRL